MTYKAEKWTVISSSAGEHELWATLNEAGEPVAFGGDDFCKAYATKLNAQAQEE